MQQTIRLAFNSNTSFPPSFVMFIYIFLSSNIFDSLAHFRFKCVRVFVLNGCDKTKAAKNEERS